MPLIVKSPESIAQSLYTIRVSFEIHFLSRNLFQQNCSRHQSLKSSQISNYCAILKCVHSTEVFLIHEDNVKHSRKSGTFNRANKTNSKVLCIMLVKVFRILFRSYILSTLTEKKLSRFQYEFFLKTFPS